MSLFERLLQAVRSWRRRGGRARSVRTAGVMMEQLDHRQLLTVAFTGNVAIDFPATQVPGVVVLPNNPSVQHPTMPAALEAVVGKSGFDVNEVRVTYTPEDGGTLFLGIRQPTNPFDPQGRDVIASDADNNGNSGSVNPIILSGDPPDLPANPGFQDPHDFGGSEFMGVYLDFLGQSTGQIVAGFSQAVPSGQAAKTFQVAEAIQLAPNAIPVFGTQLPQYEGNIYTQNDPNHPNMELSIVQFDTLYKSITGSDLTKNSVIKVGAFGGSGVDLPITEALFPLQPVLIDAATPPDPEPPPVCPPISPPILINPHEHRIIDNTHASLVRVYVNGTSGFDPSTIDPATVDLNGAKPVSTRPYQFPRSPFPSQVFVFRASDIEAEPGLQTLTFTGKTTDGQDVVSQNVVVNVPSSRATGRMKFLMNRGVESQYNSLRRLAATNPEAILDWTVFDRPTQAAAVPTGVDLGTATAASVSIPGATAAAPNALTVNYAPATQLGEPTPIVAPRQVVSVPSEETSARRISTRLDRGLEDYLDTVRVGESALVAEEEVMSGAH